MDNDLPAFIPSSRAGTESPVGAPSQPLTRATVLTSIPGFLVGGFLVVAISISMLRGDADEWGIGPFFLGVGLFLVALPAAGIALAVLGQRAERRTSRRSPWSILGLGLAVVAAVPSVLLVLLMR